MLCKSVPTVHLYFWLLTAPSNDYIDEDLPDEDNSASAILRKFKEWAEIALDTSTDCKIKRHDCAFETVLWKYSLTRGSKANDQFFLLFRLSPFLTF